MMIHDERELSSVTEMEASINLGNVDEAMVVKLDEPGKRGDFSPREFQRTRDYELQHRTENGQSRLLELTGDEI